MLDYIHLILIHSHQYNNLYICLDVFVTENTIENSQILLENLTDESINIYQNGLEKYMQILQPKEIQTLKLFSLESIDYVIETSNSFSPIKFDTMEEKDAFK